MTTIPCVRGVDWGRAVVGGGSEMTLVDGPTSLVDGSLRAALLSLRAFFPRFAWAGARVTRFALGVGSTASLEMEIDPFGTLGETGSDRDLARE
jgi:hypothetical protein